jgi:hypothetical protein
MIPAVVLQKSWGSEMHGPCDSASERGQASLIIDRHIFAHDQREIGLDDFAEFESRACGNDCA